MRNGKFTKADTGYRNQVPNTNMDGKTLSDKSRYRYR